jgi:hypothetical protein
MHIANMGHVSLLPSQIFLPNEQPCTHSQQQAVYLPKDCQLQFPPTPTPLLPGWPLPLCGSSDVVPLTAAPSGTALGRPCSRK